MEYTTVFNECNIIPFYHSLGVFLVGFSSLLCGGNNDHHQCNEYYQTFFMSCWIFGGLGMFVCEPLGFFVVIAVLGFVAWLYRRYHYSVACASSSCLVNGTTSCVVGREEICGDVMDASKEIELLPMEF